MAWLAFVLVFPVQSGKLTMFQSSPHTSLKIFDTQIVSYAFNGNWPKGCKQGHISSITALEFLQAQGESPKQARYYVPMPHPHLLAEIRERDHPFSKRVTDQVIIDFASEFPPHVEYGTLALSEVINLQATDIFNGATNFLEKRERKLLRSRFAFLCAQQIVSIPLSKKVIATGLALFAAFVSSFRPKENIRNTVNDLLILATAIESAATFVSVDSTLVRFAGKACEVPIEGVDGYVELDFSQTPGRARRTMKGSKGYINRGWRYNFSR